MRNQRRSHSLQPINRASTIDPQSQEFLSLVSTNNLAQVLLLQTTERHPLTSSSSSSSATPSLERSPPVSRQTTSRPSRPPPPPPRPPPYDGPIFDHIRIPSHLLNDARPLFYAEQRLQRLLFGLIPDPTNTRPHRSPITFEPTRTVRDNIDLLNDVKKLIIQASELHQDIEVKLTRIQLQLLRQDFERQDEIERFSDLH
jgi:hypothetical protein